MRFIPFLLLLSLGKVFSQDNDIIIGQNATKIGAALFDLSDPTGVNIEVNVWGTVRYPGRYRVPAKTTFLDLMSYAGGPMDNTKLDNIRIYRLGDSLSKKPEIIMLDYEDIVVGEKSRPVIKSNPTLKPDDVIILSEEKNYSFRENIGFYLPLIASILSIITLVIALTKK